MAMERYGPDPKGKNGFALVELQVGILILMLAAGGLAAVLSNYVKQLQRLEKQQALFTYISPDLSKVVFTEYNRGGPSQRVQQVQVQSLQGNSVTLQAVVNLLAKP